VPTLPVVTPNCSQASAFLHEMQGHPAWLQTVRGGLEDQPRWRPDRGHRPERGREELAARRARTPQPRWTARCGGAHAQDVDSRPPAYSSRRVSSRAGGHRRDQPPQRRATPACSSSRSFRTARSARQLEKSDARGADSKSLFLAKWTSRIGYPESGQLVLPVTVSGVRDTPREH
jgi:hypothetical protein